MHTQISKSDLNLVANIGFSIIEIRITGQFPLSVILWTAGP